MVLYHSSASNPLQHFLFSQPDVFWSNHSLNFVNLVKKDQFFSTSFPRLKLRQRVVCEWTEDIVGSKDFLPSNSVEDMLIGLRNISDRTS